MPLTAVEADGFRTIAADLAISAKSVHVNEVERRKRCEWSGIDLVVP